MISPRGLERRESGKNLSDSVTEKSDDSSVTQGDPTPSTLFSLYTPSILRRWNIGYYKLIHSRPPERYPNLPVFDYLLRIGLAGR
jgi:hypothetical protein